MSKSECAIVLAAKEGHVGVCELLLDIPVKCLRKHGASLSEHFRNGRGGMTSQRQQDCANLIEEGYLKELPLLRIHIHLSPHYLGCSYTFFFILEW